MSASEPPIAGKLTFTLAYLSLKSCQKISASYPVQSKTVSSPVTCSGGVSVGNAVAGACDASPVVAAGLVGAIVAAPPPHAATSATTLRTTPARSRARERRGCIVPPHRRG